MATNPYNQPRKRGKGVTHSNLAREIRRMSEAKRDTTQTALICDGGKLMVCSEGIEESAEDYLIPRRSLTRKLHLEAWPQQIEVEALKPTVRHQTGKGGKLIETTDPKSRVVWKSDRTLLTQGKPSRDLEDIKFTRIKHYTKRRVVELEGPSVVTEVITDLHDDPNFPTFPLKG